MASGSVRARVVTVGSAAAIMSPQSVDDVRDLMLDALRADEPVRICGADTWRAGPPVHAARTLSMRALTGIIAYVPGDLTLTAWAGTSLAELSHAAAAHGQWLGLDPAGDRNGTIGATIATASSGPLAHAFGTPRDLVLGIDAVTGYGDVVRPGGRVVKNVAGFDLVRLYTGSWGTLGAITSLTLRLRALPVHDVTLAIDVGDMSRLQPLMHAMRQNTIAMLACEWIDAATASALDIGTGTDVVLVRIGGNDAFVRGQQQALGAIASVRRCEPSVWGALAAIDRDASAVLRVSGATNAAPERITRLRAAAQDSGVDVSLHASLGRGIVRVIARGDVAALRTALQHVPAGEERVVERVPDSWWASEPDPFMTGLGVGIRAAFDPQRLCNRRSMPDA